MSVQMATVRLLRQGSYQLYQIPYESGKTVLDALEYIYVHLDGSLGFRYHCRAGYCVGCGVEVNGKKVLACTTYMTEDMTIKPLGKRKLIRDLITELKVFSD